MSELRTDFKDDILDVTQNEKRKYRVIHNEDGTISLEDATVYLQQGDSFGANDLNEMNRMANQMNEAAGEILTMADDIDTLQEDVETLESGIASERLLWNIGEQLHSESSLLINLPIEFEICKTVELEGVLHLFGLSTDGKNYHYKYENDSWTIGSTLPTNTYFKDNYAPHFCTYKGSIYMCIGTLNGRYPGQYLYKLNENNTWVSITMSNTHTNGSLVNGNASGQITSGICVYDDLLYFVYGHVGTSPQQRSLVVTSYDGTNSVTEYSIVTNATGNPSYVHCLGAYDGKIFIMGTHYGEDSFIIYDIEKKNHSVELYKRYNSMLQMSTSLDKLFVLSRNKTCTGTYKINDLAHRDRIFELDGFIDIGEYNNKMIAVDNQSINEIKLYKIATSYATKGTKIYLSDNSLAISDNLEAIDNGYLVTADGEVKIAIYE